MSEDSKIEIKIQSTYDGTGATHKHKKASPPSPNKPAPPSAHKSHKPHKKHAQA